MRELFTKKVLRGQLKMPTDSDLEKLARVLEHWRGEFQRQSYSQNRRSLQSKVFAALASASEKLVQFDQGELNTAKEHAPQQALSYLKERLAESEDFCAEIEHIKELIEKGLPPGLFGHPALSYSPAINDATGWKWLADVLPADFVTAMKSANPEFAPGISHSGPVARFIAAVTPLITGEEPTIASVATQLKTRRRDRDESCS
ncbi:MAG TPA: hypothetical protein VHN11_01150 [Xanthobacteraceae bacterium]|nr:hypothetical protein [Xanthobacteraceae bacterium]